MLGGNAVAVGPPQCRTACFAVLLLSSAVAWATPRLSPEVPLDPTPGLEPLSSFTYSPSVAFTGAQFALTWHDSRSGNDASYAALIDLDGTVAEAGRRVLTDADDFSSSGQLVGCRYGGELFWAGAAAYTWAALLRTTPALDRVWLGRYPAVIGIADQVSCRGPLPLWLTALNLYNPTDFRLQAAFVLSDGGLQAPDGGMTVVSRLQLDDPDLVSQSVDFDGTQYLVAWTDGRNRVSLPDGGVDDPTDLYAAFLSPQAGFGAPFLVAGGPGTQALPQVAFDGTRFIVAWSDAPTRTGPHDLFLRTVSPSGLLGAVVPLATSADDELEPRLSFDGRAVVAAWGASITSHDVELRTAQVTSGLVQPTVVVARSWFDSVRLASSADGHSLLTARDFNRGIREVGVLLRDGQPASGLLDPATTVTSQTAPRARRGLTAHSVFWHQSRQIVGAPVDVAGTVGALGPLAAQDRDLLGIAAGGGAYLALWDDRQSSWLSDDLSPLDAGAPQLGTAATRGLSGPSWDGRGFLVAEGERTDAGTELFAERVLLDGGLEGRWDVASAPASAGALDVASTGTGRALLAWSDFYRVGGRCFDDDGGRAAPFELARAAYVPFGRVASDGRGFLMAWFGNGIEALLLGEDCDLDAGLRLNLGAALLSLYDPVSVAWDGRQYVVGYVSNGDAKGDVVVVRVQTDGGVSPPILVAADPRADEGQPSVSPEGPGHWLVAYTRFEGDESRSARRAFARWVTDDSEGAPCTVAADCGSGSCVGGGCCAEPCAADAGAGPLTFRVGCGCTSASTGELALLLLGLGLGLRRAIAARRNAH